MQDSQNPEGTTYEKDGMRHAGGLLSGVTEKVRNDGALRREREIISEVPDTAGALVVVLDREGHIVRFNRACERTTGYSFDEVQGKLLWDLFLVPEEVEPVKAVFEALQAGQFPNECENCWATKDGGRRLIAWSNTALLGADGAVEYVIGTGIDVTERRQAESQRDATLEALIKARFLELLATGGDFFETLHTLVRLIEDQWPGMLGLILLLDEDGRHLHIGASVSLPQDYVRSIEGLEIGPMVGSCGTACYRRERVIVEDTATDPRWDGLRDLALQYSLRACWSEPVFSIDGQVVGTFTMYCRQPRTPTGAELRTIEMGAHLVGIAIEHERAQQSFQKAYQILEQRVEERTRELAVLNSIAAVVSGSLDLKEIMSAALIKTLDAMDMESGTAYCLECNNEQPAETIKPDSPNALGREIVKQMLMASQEAPVQTGQTNHLRLLAYHGVSADYAKFVGDVRLPGTATALARVGNPFVWLVEDTVPADTAFRQFLEREDCRQIVTLPLIAKDNLVGAINLGTRTPRTFAPDQLALLSAVGQQIGMAVENARLYEAEQERWEETEDRRRVAEGMREILTVLNSRQSLQGTLDFIASQICRLLGSDAAAILRLEDGLLRMQAACGLDADFISGVTLRLGEGGAGRALATRQPVIVSDLAEAILLTPEHEIPPEPQRSLIERLFQEFRAILSVPLIVQGRDYGAITVYYKGPREFSTEDLDPAMSVADQVALAIENARLREQAGQAAALEERGRLARELHDSVTQSLYSVTMYTEAAARLMTAGQETDAAEYLRDARDTAQEALREMRLMIYQLRPPALEKGGLALALQVRLDAVERHGGIHAELIVEGREQLPPAIQAELHQIAQEALNNALKHAHAREVQVRLHFSDATTRLEVQDDGVGFELANAQTEGGLGLPGMRERVLKIGGRLKINSAPGKGTTVVVEVPIGGGA
jgi:PAS domain S-box-containing protein